MEKKNKVVTGMFIGLLIVMILGSIPTLSFLLSGVAIWYFMKKSPNKRYRNYSITVAVLSLIMMVGTTETVDTASEQPNQSIATVESESKEDTEKKEQEAKAESLALKEEKKKKEQEKDKKEQEETRKKEQEEKAKAEAESKAIAESVAIAESKEIVEKEAIEKKEAEVEQQRVAVQTATPSVPAGNTYIEVNGNVPLFTNADISSTEAWEDYGDLDHLGRVTVANAVLGVELMPAEERGDISSVHPTGWNQAQYSVVSGGWLYNRSHLIGHQLAGEDANVRNLMTGTRWFNTEGMLPFENFVANYVESTENHVRYRVTPHFEGDNLLASGVYMEGLSIEDNGEGLMFHIYVPNIQPSVNLDYSNGLSWADTPEVNIVEEPVVETVPEVVEQPIVEETPPPVQENVFYQNCTAVRAAGADPIRAGDPGWDTKFDRDGDGVGCE